MENEYDPITLGHWLFYKLRCYEASGAEFQHLFEDIIKRAHPEFVSIKPYGNIGDKKCDGLYHSGKTVFQVYSPDRVILSRLKAKVTEDLDGAVEHWKAELEEWNFVFNTRSGLAPDIPLLLASKQKQYPKLKINYLSSDNLWEIARGLTVQQRSEILGPPIVSNQILLPSGSNNSNVGSDFQNNNLIVIVQDIMSPVNIQSVSKAILPNSFFGAPLHIKPPFDGDWELLASYQEEAIEELLSRSWNLSPKFAVFSLAPIPLATQLGFLLSNRVEVECFQFNRDRRSWNWSEEEPPIEELKVQIKGIPQNPVNSTEVVLVVSISDQIDIKKVQEAIGSPQHILSINVVNPSVHWLKSKTQLDELTKAYRQVLSEVRNKVPKCTQIHLFYAGPTSGAIRFGQELNPRMDPAVITYQYSRQKSPRYERAIILQG